MLPPLPLLRHTLSHSVTTRHNPSHSVAHRHTPSHTVTLRHTPSTNLPQFHMVRTPKLGGDPDEDEDDERDPDTGMYKVRLLHFPFCFIMSINCFLLSLRHNVWFMAGLSLQI